MNADQRCIDPLEVMLENAQLGVSFADGMDFAAFQKDDKTQHALAMTLIIVGEMGARIMRRNPKFAEDHPEMPWKQMIGMRNRIAHDYDSIDINVVWEIAQGSLPALVREIPKILKPLLDKYDPPKPTPTPES
jgi:uncharacterized protein with HEPN domain